MICNIDTCYNTYISGRRLSMHIGWPCSTISCSIEICTTTTPPFAGSIYPQFTKVADRNIWKASFRQDSPYHLESSTLKKLHLLTLSRLTCPTKNFIVCMCSFHDQPIMNIMKRSWILCLDTHMELALYKYAIIIYIIILLLLFLIIGYHQRKDESSAHLCEWYF